MVVEKPLIGQTVIAPYMKDANNHILFTIKYRDEILQRRTWERLRLPTRLEPDSIRTTEVTADSTI